MTPAALVLRGAAASVDGIIFQNMRVADLNGAGIRLERGNLDLSALKTLVLDEMTVLVLDEADRMLDMGFADDIDDVISYTPPQRQTLLFPAHFPDPTAGRLRCVDTPDGPCYAYDFVADGLAGAA